MQKRFKDFIIEASKEENEHLLHQFYSIVSKPDYTDDQLREFFESTEYKPTRREYEKIYDLHEVIEDLFDTEYKDY
jgi:hypothetical protein